MQPFENEFVTTLNHSVRIGRRSGTTTTPMGNLAPSGETTVNSGMSVFMQPWSGKKLWGASGNFAKVDYVMLFRYVESVQPGDLVYPVTNVVGLSLGEVVYVEPIMDLDGHTHHTEAYVQRVG